MSDLFLTYSELAEKLGIKVDSAKKLAQRRKWARIVGNDGFARVKVPPDAVPAHVVGVVPQDVVTPIVPDLSPRVAHLEGLVEGLKGQLQAEKKRADAAEARTRDVEGDRDAWRQQAQRSLWQRLFGK